MIKTDTDKMVLEEEQQILSVEESAFDLPMPEITTEKDQEALELGQVTQNSDILLGIITEQVRSKRIWQIATVCLTIFAVIISFICLGLYMERENHIERFSQAQANVQKASNDFAQTSQKAKTLEKQLVNSKAELKHAQGDLKNSKSEIENLQSQLADTSQRLKALQNRNAEAVKRLNERLRKLSDRPIETTKNHQIPSAPSISSR